MPVFDFAATAPVGRIAESLDRLGVERVDVLHIHDPDDHFDEAMTGARPALVEMRTEGLVGRSRPA